MNALTWLNSYINQEMEISPKLKSKLTPDSYFRVLSRKEAKFIRETDFSICLLDVFPSELLEFTDAQKEEIDKIVVEFEDFLNYLELLSKVLRDFERAETLDCDIAKAFLETYNYLKSKLEQRFPQAYNQYRSKIAVFKEKSTERPNCPECGSKEIVSNGRTKWLCNSCGRQFKKQRLGSQSRHS